MHLNRSWRYGLSQSTDENLYGNRVSQGIGIYNVMYVPLMIHSVMELLLSPHPVQVVEMTITGVQLLVLHTNVEVFTGRGYSIPFRISTGEFGNSSGQSWKRSLGPR
jgi:hypothetical protein